MHRLPPWLLLLLPLAAHGGGPSVADDNGDPVSLSGTARRIVTLAPHLTELTISAGAGAQLVAVSPGSPPHPVSDSLPRIGGPGGLDRERLLTLRPDLVLAWRSGNRATDIDWLKRQGIAVYQSEPARLRDIADTIGHIGVLSGNRSAAAAAATSFLDKLVAACDNTSNREVYFSIWDKPAITIGARHWLNDALRLAGARNTYADIERGAFPVETEARVAKSGLLRIKTHGQDSAYSVTEAELARPGAALPAAIARLCQRIRP